MEILTFRILNAALPYEKCRHKTWQKSTVIFDTSDSIFGIAVPGRISIELTCDKKVPSLKKNITLHATCDFTWNHVFPSRILVVTVFWNRKCRHAKIPSRIFKYRHSNKNTVTAMKLPAHPNKSTVRGNKILSFLC